MQAIGIWRWLHKLSNFKLLGNYWVNWNQSWLEWSLDGFLHKLCFFLNWIKLSRWSPEPIMESDCQLFPRSCGPKFKEGCNEKIEKNNKK